ncbi:EF-hand domain-containing family member C2 [Lampris incognitus]|uniref:EF-hand domain-containing family member C2 n=1 Tax=Lampris incognitus TaxID=2546036 RepID=UPI0024B61AB4|nr:EF-hand domain-containing family member C2 [Lampris incognitus]
MDLSCFNKDAMALPFLPGYPRKQHLGKETFHKSQQFGFSNEVAMLRSSEKKGIGGELLEGQKNVPNYSAYPRVGSGLPSWLAFDKQVLCFEAYFQEAMCETREETNRIRRCMIYFYLEDDTIQVVERKYKNSGIPQGTLIRRHRIPLPPPNDELFYNVYHFNLNQQLVLYSRTFTVTDCDAFTRTFLMKLGVRLNAPTATPEDQYSNLREQMEKSMKPLRPYQRRDTLKQFLDHDGKVLRFYCVWYETDSVSGDPRELILHYFLADDTVEIREVVEPNSGRDVAPKFLHRGKLPKTGAVREEFYRDGDLAVGGEVNVWGRTVLICDCDDFTKEYYRSKYGIEDFTPVQYKAPPPPKPPKLVPPYNGFGSEEDSLCSCQGLLPKPPRKDLRKFMDKDRNGLEGNVLRFRAKMVTNDPVNRDRGFIVSFYLCDDTIRIFEPPQKNSGVLGGKFLERSRVKKPGQDLFRREMPEYFSAQDLYVGVTLNLNNKFFELVDADEYTFSYMERHAEEFSKANVGTILSKLRSIPEEKQIEIGQFLGQSDPAKTGIIPYQSLRDLLMGMQCGLSEHEVITLGRFFSEREPPEAEVGFLLAVVQDRLKRKQFEKFPEMCRVFVHRDRRRTGCLSAQETRSICKTFQLPLADDLLMALLTKFTEEDKINYHAFLSGIDWRENPAAPLLHEATLKLDGDRSDESGGPTMNNVRYSPLMENVFSRPADDTQPPQ